MGDVHSLLLLLCPDFPLGGVKNCWSSAVALQTCEQAAGCGPQAVMQLLPPARLRSVHAASAFGATQNIYTPL